LRDSAKQFTSFNDCSCHGPSASLVGRTYVSALSTEVKKKRKLIYSSNARKPSNAAGIRVKAFKLSEQVILRCPPTTVLHKVKAICTNQLTALASHSTPPIGLDQ
jgi:hypothetical protein